MKSPRPVAETCRSLVRAVPAEWRQHHRTDMASGALWSPYSPNSSHICSCISAVWHSLFMCIPGIMQVAGKRHPSSSRFQSSSSSSGSRTKGIGFFLSLFHTRYGGGLISRLLAVTAQWPARIFVSRINTENAYHSTAFVATASTVFCFSATRALRFGNYVLKSLSRRCLRHLRELRLVLIFCEKSKMTLASWTHLKNAVLVCDLWFAALAQIECPTPAVFL